MQGSKGEKEDVGRSNAREDDWRHPDQSAASHAVIHQVGLHCLVTLFLCTWTSFRVPAPSADSVHVS